MSFDGSIIPLFINFFGCVGSSSSCGEQVLLFIAVCAALLIAVASLVAEHGL